jgi:Cdc6-like AAA superfamily ATPase
LILIAGTGKTYLTSRVIDEIRSALKSNPNHEGLAFFYCNRNETERQEPLSVLRSFVRQLSTIIKDENSIQKRLKQFYIQTRLKASEPTIGDCKELLLEFINLYPKTTLILDALDECDKQKRRVLIEIFDYFLARASRPVKIFISSRPDGDIRERFKGQANIEIQATDNHDDISRFVESEITKHLRWNKISLELQKEIVEKLQKGSQGM